MDLVRSSGFEASSVESGAAMDRMMARQQFDLVVLDAMLPAEDGFSICRRLRASCSVPILMLTALQEDIDRILGLSSEPMTMSRNHSTPASCWPESRVFSAERHMLIIRRKHLDR